MALQLVWRHPDRHEVENALYVMLRMVHVRGWQRLAVLCERDGHTWCCVELTPACSEADARDWSQLFDRRHRRDVAIDELLADPWRFPEIYLNGGVGPLLDEVERQQLERDRLKREARR
jgi:hypothetical protein